MASSAEEVPDAQATKVSNMDVAHDRSNDVLVNEPNDTTRREKEINDAITAFLPELLDFTSYLKSTIDHDVDILGKSMRIEGCCRTSGLNDPASCSITQKVTVHEMAVIIADDADYALAQSIEKIYDHTLRSLSYLKHIRDAPTDFKEIPTDHWQAVVLNLKGFYMHRLGKQGTLRKALDGLKSLEEIEAVEFAQVRSDLKLLSDQEITEWGAMEMSDQVNAIHRDVKPIVDAVNATIDMAIDNPFGVELDILVNGISVDRDQKLWKVLRARCGFHTYNHFQTKWPNFQVAVKKFVETIGGTI